MGETEGIRELGGVLVELLAVYEIHSGELDVATKLKDERVDGNKPSLKHTKTQSWLQRCDRAL